MRALVIAAALAATLVAGVSTASAASFVNTTPISIPEHGKATPYGSPLDVQGVPGLITDVYVSLRGVTHSEPADLDVLLVAPDGTASVLMSDACGTGSVQSATWTFQQAEQPMPEEGCPEFFYRPTNFGAGDVWPADAPAGSHPANLDTFVGRPPNGVWKLYVVDDAPEDSGKIANGWSLTLQTANPIAYVPSGNGGSSASKYPFTRAVGGVDGVITGITVTLDGLYHQRASDLDVLLVGPRGQTAMLMSDACGNDVLKDPQFAFGYPGGGGLGAGGCPARFTYAPTNYQPGDALPAPAPAPPYGSDLLPFLYTDPNGDWKVYVSDDTPGDANGFITSNFRLDLTTRPRANTYLLDEAVEVDEGETANLRLFRDTGGKGLGAATIQVAAKPLTATGGEDFEPVSRTLELHAAADQTVTIPVQTLADALPEDTETFEVTLSDATGDAKLGAPATAVVTIRDDDQRPPDPPKPGGTQGGGPQGPGPVTGSGGNGGAGGAGGPAVDRTAPVLSALRIKRRRVRFTLSEAATVTVTVTRGRKTVRTLRLPAVAGRNALRLGGKKLKRGRYRVRVVAVDAAGNRSVARTRRLKVGR